ncbi:MAG: methylthioadenosine phosphorylase [Actinomycetia bacterium]|nr:methylthioadenosine phosphorylase [Actinomycetes bacterium]
MTGASAAIGVFGGSGFYSFLDDVEDVEIDTPFGAPAAPVAIGSIDGTRVAFLPRHGRAHQFPPHAVPAKANLWAMRAVGVHSIIGPCAAGSLDAGIAPGDFVVLDQLVDRTHSRPDTYYDRGDAHHVAFADPYCSAIAPFVAAAGEAVGITTHPRGTVVVVNGPRFSTRAESRWYRAQGWHVINMTQYPEAYLARELGIHYAGIALVTDYDTGVEDDPNIEPVTHEQVFEFFEANVHHIRDLLTVLIPTLPAEPTGCECARAIGPLHHYE